MDVNEMNEVSPSAKGVSYLRYNDLITIMKGITKDGGELCLTYLKRSKISELLEKYNVISDKLEHELETEYYSNSTAKPIGSIVVAEK